MDGLNLSPDVAHNEKRLAIATSAASLGIWDWDLLTNTLVYSQRARAICGFPADGPVTLDMARAVTHPDDFLTTHAISRRAIDPDIRSSEVYRYRIRRHDTGELRWVTAHGEAIFEQTADGVRAVRYTGTLQDVTEQKLAEDALIESEARLRMAIETARMAVWELDLETQTLTPSPELNALCGFPPDATPTLEDVRARYAPGERERLQEVGAAATARGETKMQTEFRQIWPDGTEKWLMLRAQLAPETGRPGRRAIGVLVDITEQKLAEQRLSLVAQELQHRVKNSLAVVQTIATQSFRNRSDMEEGLQVFSDRLRALAATNDIAIQRGLDEVELKDVIQRIIGPYRDKNRDPFRLDGPGVSVDNAVSVAIGMALHELCTNAVKYGALSAGQGEVSISWTLRRDGGLVLSWAERNGPAVQAPERQGFGTRLLERGLFGALGGTVQLDFRKDGLFCEISLPKRAEAA